MNRDERQPDWENLLRLVQDDVMSRMRVALPGIIDSISTNPLRCNVQMGVKVSTSLQTGADQVVDPTLLVDVPIKFMGTAGFVFTLPVAKGDEVLVIFCDRDIGPFKQSGGLQTSFWTWMHHHSDAIAIPGGISALQTPANVSETSAQLRTFEGDGYIELTAEKAVNVVAPGGFNVTAPTSTFNGDVATAGALTNNEVDVGSDHVHVSGAEGSDGGPPKKGP